jgi:hypothetical protein
MDGDGGPGPLEDGWSDDHAQVYQATGMVSAQRGVELEEALAARWRARAPAARGRS